VFTDPHRVPYRFRSDHGQTGSNSAVLVLERIGGGRHCDLERSRAQRTVLQHLVFHRQAFLISAFLCSR